MVCFLQYERVHIKHDLREVVTVQRQPCKDFLELTDVRKIDDSDYIEEEGEILKYPENRLGLQGLGMSLRRMYEVININTYRSSIVPITRDFSLRSVNINDIQLAVKRACDRTLIFKHQTKQEYFQKPNPSDRVNKKHWFEKDDVYLREMFKNFLHVVAMIPIIDLGARYPDKDIPCFCPFHRKLFPLLKTTNKTFFIELSNANAC